MYYRPGWVGFCVYAFGLLAGLGAIASVNHDNALGAAALVLLGTLSDVRIALK
jgi:hypothetical protein